MKLLIKSVLILLSLFVCAGCGYHMTGGTLGAIPTHIQTIAVPMFKNTSGEPNLEKQVTEAVIEKFQSVGKPRLVKEKEADALLLGTVTRYNPNVSLAFTSGRDVQEFRMEITGDLMIKEVSTGKIIWQKKAHYSKREFTVDSDLSTTKVSELEAKKLTAFEFARDIISVLEGF